MRAKLTVEYRKEKHLDTLAAAVLATRWQAYAQKTKTRLKKKSPAQKM